MKPESVINLRKELKHKSSEELQQLCLRLARFKAENKELLTYLLFEAENEENYISTVKNNIDVQFSEISSNNYYHIKKSVRKIQRNTKKFIRYSGQKETEVELLLYFCKKLKVFRPSVLNNTTLHNIYLKQLELVSKKILKLHEDLQYDFNQDIKTLEQNL